MEVGAILLSPENQGGKIAANVVIRKPDINLLGLYVPSKAPSYGPPLCTHIVLEALHGHQGLSVHT